MNLAKKLAALHGLSIAQLCAGLAGLTAVINNLPNLP